MDQLIQKNEASYAPNVIGVFMAQVYGWMTLGLFLSFAVAFGLIAMMDSNPRFAGPVMLALPFIMIFELIIVVAIYRSCNFSIGWEIKCSNSWSIISFLCAFKWSFSWDHNV
jgi:FtsH-binding integral membrane protein